MTSFTRTSIDVLNLDNLPPNYVKTMIRVSITEVKLRLIADSFSNVTGTRLNDKILCCLFLNNLSFSLQTGYGWWEVSCGINNLALKDYSSSRNQLKYLIKRNDEYYSSVRSPNGS